MAEDRSALSIARAITAAFNRMTTLTNELRKISIRLADLDNRVKMLEENQSGLDDEES